MVESIPIQLVEPDPVALIRLKYFIDNLEESIAQLGQIEPINVYKKGEKYYVYVGVRRYFAIKSLCEKYGKPCEIEVKVDETEPDFETKMARIADENAKRDDLSLYDKLFIVLFRTNMGETLIKRKVISEHFFNDAYRLRYNITENDIKRWNDIEMKVSGKVKLTLEHIKKIVELNDKEKQDFAVAVLSYLEVPVTLASNIHIYLINAANNPRLTKALKEKGIENPYEKEPVMFKPQELQPEPRAQPVKTEWRTPMAETKPETAPAETKTAPPEIPEEAIEAPESTVPKEAFQPQKVVPRNVEIKEEPEVEEEKPVKEEEPPTMALFRKESRFFAIDDVYVIFYNGVPKPEVRFIEITEGEQIIDINGKKFRIKLMNSP